MITAPITAMTKSRPGRLLLGACIVLGGLGVATACSPSDDDDPLADTESIDADSPDGAGSGAGSGSGQSGARDDVPDDVLGSAESQLPANPGNQSQVPLRVDVMAVERQGDLVEVRLQLTNLNEGDGEAFEIWSHFSGDNVNYDLRGVGLVDSSAQKLYLPVLDSGDACLCSSGLADYAVAPGETVRLNATFGGLPDDVEQVDVRVPGFSAVDGVPVS